MPTIIAGTYELIKRVGSGGAGIVYLGRHLRLDKLVVLKADKRSSNSPQRFLRQEVDSLKNLRHSNIPQVYDYVVENDSVYTVMDYIEGESLDKPLKRGQRFSQVQVIEWACQLLDALQYLHTRPPNGILHCDIKPANIMITPRNEIRLIDFNIAYALGDSGAIQVAYSKGYASPEHYGRDLAFGQPDEDATEAQQVSTAEPCDSRTDLVTDRTGWTTRAPELLGRVTEFSSFGTGEPRASGSTSDRRKVLLDVRSDIYSLGATLYHLLSGNTPPRRAEDVPKLCPPAVSPLIGDIIAKAMAPDPSLRYQSATEMLAAFEHLYEADSRTRQLKRRTSISVAFLTAAFFLGGLMNFAGLAQARRLAEERAKVEQAAAAAAQLQAEQEERAKNALEWLAQGRTALSNGELSRAAACALDVLDLGTSYDAQAQYLLTEALGVYDLDDGYQAVSSLELPSAPVKASLSPGGRWVAAVCSGMLLLYDSETGQQCFSAPMAKSVLSDMVFLHDGALAFAGEDGLKVLDLSSMRYLWSGKEATMLCASGDGRRIAATALETGEALIYDTESGAVLSAVSFSGKRLPAPANSVYIDSRDTLFRLNQDGSLLAVSFSDGSVELFSTESESVFLVPQTASQYTHFEGGFYQKWFVYSAMDASVVRSRMMAINLSDPSRSFSAESTVPFQVQAGEDGVYLANGNTLVQFDPDTREQREAAYTTERDIYAFHATENACVVTTETGVAFFDGIGRPGSREETGNACAFVALGGDYAMAASRDSPLLRLYRMKTHPGAAFFSYDPDYVHWEARVSADERTVMLFRRGSFRLFSLDGTLLCEKTLPDEAQIYDHQYRRASGDSWLEVLYYDGLIRNYSAVNGELLSEQQGPPPAGDLEEDFFTEQYRIHTSPHTAPKAYALDTGALVRELPAEDDVTYVTQLGDNIVVEYISTTGERYGILMNGELEAIARLPKLCDIVNGKLFFDDYGGVLKTSPVWPLPQLRAAASELTAP